MVPPPDMINGFLLALISTIALAKSMVSGIVRQLESTGEQEIASSAIGEIVCEALRGLDPVAYVRFASVYRDFREASDFQEVLTEIAKGNGAGQKAHGQNDFE